MIKGVGLVLGVLFFSVECFSQSGEMPHKVVKDSVNIPRRAVAYAADKFAIVRPLNIEFTHLAPYNFSSEQGATSLPKSKVNRFTQVKMSANFNFIKRKTWLLGSTLKYKYTKIETDRTAPFLGDTRTVNDEFHYLFSSLNFSYFSTLFRRGIIYTSSLMVDGSDQHFERIKGILSGVMVLKATQRTKMTAGVLVNIDPSAQSPVVPVFTYEHKFYNGLTADIILPQSMYLRRYVLANGRVALGTELDQTSFYLYNIDGTSQRYEYRQLDINSGLSYEYAIGSFLVTAKTGMKLSPYGKLFRKGDSYKDKVLKTSPHPSFYFSIGVSLHPFAPIKKK